MQGRARQGKARQGKGDEQKPDLFTSMSGNIL